MKKILLILLLLATPLMAQVRQGYDVLGVAMYCQEFLKAPKMEAMSVLMNTFGDPIPCIKKRIAKGGLKLVQIDLIDATCWRNNKCPAGVPRADDLDEIRKRARQILPLAKEHPDIEFWLSPALEHDVKDEGTVIKMLKAAQAGCPRCKVINSPYSGTRPKGYPLELHGTKISQFAVSGDGASSLDADNMRSDGNTFQHRLAGEHQSYAWIWEFNLRCTGEEAFTPPKERTEKPTAALFSQVYQVMQKEEVKPIAPKICKTVRDIASNEINKPNAENYCNGQKKDPRSNKNLLIIQHPGKKGDRLPVYSKDGWKVAEFCYYDTFNEIKGAHRWYMGDCTRQNPYELYQQLKSEWGFAVYDKDKCLRFNALRRQGIYR